MKIISLFAALTIFSMSSCDIFKKPAGCTDSGALNFDFEASSDNGTCSYSEAIFYGAQFSPCPPVVVQVNGSTAGTIQAAYPGGPGNCGVPGVARFSFSNGQQVDWIATDACGFIFSGTLRPSRTNACMKIRVF